MRRSDTTDISAFLAIVEHGNFRRAAAALNVSPSALSHAMRGLEARVGVRLLNRTTRSVALSDAGQQLLQEVRPAMQTIEAAIVALAEEGDRLRGRIRINAPEVGARILLESVVVHFANHHPDVEIEIDTDDTFVDIVAAGFDAGVRLREAVPRDMIAVPIAPETAMMAVATPAYFATRSIPNHPSDLMEHRCVRFRHASGAYYRWEFEKNGTPVSVDAPGTLTVNAINSVVDAVLNGLGIGLVLSPLVADHLETGRLIRVLEDWSPTFPGLHLYYPSKRHPPKAFSRFVGFLQGT